MIAIMGATGHTGRVAVETLLKNGKPVRAIGRDAAKLKALEEMGAEVFVGNAEKAEDLTRAFEGAEAVYAMIPPNMQAADFRAYQNKVADAIVTAVQKSGVKYVVSLSSLGADLEKGNGPVGGLYDLEQKLNTLEDVNVLHLRPPFFMENQYATMGLIKSMGINGGSTKPDMPIPMIATRDVGAHAAKRLAALDFKGKSVQELHGQRDITSREATRIIGHLIGKPDLNYIEFSYEDAINGMVGMGLPRNLAESYTELSRAANEGLLRYKEPRTASNSTATTFEEFAREFAAVFKQ